MGRILESGVMALSPGSTTDQQLLERLAQEFEASGRHAFLVGGSVRDELLGRQHDDLEAKTVRAVGDPAERFAEDPLRMLRAVRFAVTLGFQIHDATALAIAERADDLRNISRERIAEELNKVLVSPDPARGLRALV